MALSESTTVLLFSGASLLFGIVGLVRGKLQIGNETETLWEISGQRAKALSWLLVASGAALLFNASLGFGLFLFTMLALVIYRERLAHMKDLGTNTSQPRN